MIVVPTKERLVDGVVARGGEGVAGELPARSMRITVYLRFILRRASDPGDFRWPELHGFAQPMVFPHQKASFGG
jgi:hypothetical protein